MADDIVQAVLQSFQRTAMHVPAYRILLSEAGVRAETIKTLGDFRQIPVLEKANTFRRFDLAQLCVDGELGRLGTVLTSSGHSGFFAFGLSDADALPETVKWIDDSLDLLFGVRTKPTLLINCLPMGVKIPTQACTLAETSVRPDMAVSIMEALGRHFAQIILVGEAAFIKSVLELGQRKKVNWRDHRVHLILGEEPLAENARNYFQGLLGLEERRPEAGMIISSMGVAELGLNLFFEAPPKTPLALVLLRRLLHEDAALRDIVLGPDEIVPSLFTYDPRRIFVESDAAERLILTTLDLRLHVPLMRYATGDRGSIFRLPEILRAPLEARGVAWELLASIPIVAIRGRGQHARAGNAAIYPEAVKEGIYHDSALTGSTTANFRLVSGAEIARVRIQLSPGIAASAELDQSFEKAIGRYVRSPFAVTCETYETFGSGMTLDYERKFDYLGR